MFTVSDFSKEAPFLFSNFNYVFCGETRRVNIASTDTSAVNALVKRMQKDPEYSKYTVTVNSHEDTDMCICINITQYNPDNPCPYVFYFSSDDAYGMVPEIRKLEETNWLMFKYVIQSLEEKNLLNENAKTLNSERNKIRQGIDNYNANDNDEQKE